MAIFWTGTVSQRILRRDIRRTAVLVGWLVVGWTLLRLLKYQIFDSCLLARLCWYGYYVFQLALPLVIDVYKRQTIVNPDGDASQYGQNAFFYDAAEGLLTAVVLLLAEYLPCLLYTSVSICSQKFR